jgi:hypothetical protein
MFATARPRAGFEDELWRRLQPRWWSPSAWLRPAVLAPALALLVVAVGVVAFLSTAPHPGVAGGAATSRSTDTAKGTQPNMSEPAFAAPLVYAIAGPATPPAGRCTATVNPPLTEYDCFVDWSGSVDSYVAATSLTPAGATAVAVGNGDYYWSFGGAPLLLDDGSRAGFTVVVTRPGLLHVTGIAPMQLTAHAPQSAGAAAVGSGKLVYVVRGSSFVPAYQSGSTITPIAAP